MSEREWCNDAGHADGECCAACCSEQHASGCGTPCDPPGLYVAIMNLQDKLAKLAKLATVTADQEMRNPGAALVTMTAEYTRLRAFVEDLVTDGLVMYCDVHDEAMEAAGKKLSADARKALGR